MIENIFYIYAYIREDGTPYYIGKGSGSRIDNIHTHGRLTNIPPKNRRIKIKENLTEEESWNLEIELIEKYGRKGFDEGGILYNVDLGGGLSRNKYRTEEERKEGRNKTSRESSRKRRLNPEYRKNQNEYSRKWKKKNYPKEKEKLRERKHKWWKEFRKDPEKVKEYRKKQLEKYYKDYKDPVKRERMKKNARLSYHKNKSKKINWNKKIELTLNDDTYNQLVEISQKQGRNLEMVLIDIIEKDYDKDCGLMRFFN